MDYLEAYRKNLEVRKQKLNVALKDLNTELDPICGIKVEIAVTRTCSHCPIIEAELKKMKIPYSIRFVEDDAELQKRHPIKGSPNLLVDDELIFRGMPSISDLRAYFDKKG